MSNAWQPNIEVVLDTAERVALETGLDKAEVLQVMEEGLRASARRYYGGKVRAEIDPIYGTVRITRTRIVMEDEDVEDPTTEIALSEARKSEPEIQPGDEFVEILPPIPWNRHAARVAQQAINQHLRNRIRERLKRVYSLKIGLLVRGRVIRIREDAVYVQLDEGGRGVLFYEDALPGERFEVGQEISAVVMGVRDFKRAIRSGDSHAVDRGIYVILSRATGAFAVQVAKSIVPEMSMGLVVVKGCAREPGVLTKIAVAPTRRDVDAVAACIGKDASRVRAMSEALGGETVQIIRWSPSLRRYAVYAMEPAVVRSPIVDRENGVITVRAGPAHYASAIGPGGINVRLASELVGMPIKVLPGKGVAADK